MNEGEKKKKIYKKGDIVTFRLGKRLEISENVIEYINRANALNELNIEIINALELYVKYKDFRSKYVTPDITDLEKEYFEHEVFENPKVIKWSPPSPVEKKVKEQEDATKKVETVDDSDELFEKVISSNKDKKFGGAFSLKKRY